MRQSFFFFFFFFHKLSMERNLYLKLIERPNVKQRRSRWDGSLWTVSSGSMLFAKAYYYRLWQLSMLGKIFSCQHFKIFFSFSPKKRLKFWRKLSPDKTTCLRSQSLFSWKKMQKYNEFVVCWIRPVSGKGGGGSGGGLGGGVTSYIWHSTDVRAE